jgi:hypothetical protein
MLDLIYQPRPLVNQSPNLRVPNIDVSRLEPECPLNGRIEPTGRSQARHSHINRFYCSLLASPSIRIQ